jgi:hypothetical protein
MFWTALEKWVHSTLLTHVLAMQEELYGVASAISAHTSQQLATLSRQSDKVKIRESMLSQDERAKEVLIE